MISGVDVQAEVARSQRLGNTENLPEALRPGGRQEQESERQEDREESAEVKRHREKLDRLIELARKKREAANLEAEGAGEFGDDGYIPGGGGAGTSTPKPSPAAVTFSAAALVALGGEQQGVWTSKDTAAFKRIQTELKREELKEKAAMNKALAETIAVSISGLGLHHP